MPTSKFLKNFSWEDSPEGSPDASPNSTPTTRTGFVPPETCLVTDSDIPQRSDRIKEACEAVDMLAVPVKALMDEPHIVNGIAEGVNTFMEVVPVLMKALDGLADIHPFIAVAVTAFKAVYTLEMTRRNNDQRVIAIYVEMKNMMEVLIRLEDVTDLKKVAPNGQTIEGRMQNLCVEVAEDIKKCGRACDTYLKKRILTKIFSGTAWESNLVGFVEVFANKRQQFVLALSIHTAVAVEGMIVKLNVVDQRMKAMMHMLQNAFVPPEQKQLADFVNQKGGKEAIHDEQVMRELVAKEASLTAPTGNERRKSEKKFNPEQKVNLEEILREIRDTPAKAIEKNEESFNSKFNLLMKQIRADVDHVVKQQGDRIISFVIGGPHDRIKDPELRQIWKEMLWRGSVKAKHFILALKDHYEEMVAGGRDDAPSSDEWALQYINVSRVWDIMEAFDEDASGFVTIKEANNFTSSRPLDWSLPHWLAYWAIGWQMTCTSYCKKIEEIFDAMTRLLDEVLPENRTVVNEYVYYAWIEVGIFTRSIELEDGTDNLRAKFQSYVDAEEERLRKNLEDIKYDVSDYNSVYLVSRPGRIETTLFPMLYLLLQRDLQKIDLARNHVISEPELSGALDMIQWVTVVAQFRMWDLRAIFKQQGRSPREQFAIHAKGLFKMYSDNNHPREEQLRTLLDPIPANSEIILSQDSVPSSVLNHSIGDGGRADFTAYDSPTPTVPPPGDGPDVVLGSYYGFVYGGGKPLGPMRSLNLNRGSEENSIVASGTHYNSGYHRLYTLSGTTGPLRDGKMPVDLKIGYSTGWQDITMTGHFDPGENSLRGTVTWENGSPGELVFKRDPDLIRFYPAPSATDARARWKFATTVILDRIRRQSWSTSYILKRLKDGKRYMELALKDKHSGETFDDGESDEYHNLLSSFYEIDARFYASRINVNMKQSEVITHLENCDSCGAVLEGARILCMDCPFNYTTLDLCSKPECLDSVITTKDRPDLEAPHTPNHDMLKVHRILFCRDTVTTAEAAREALKAARSTISDLEAKEKPMPGCICCQNAVSLPCWYCVDCIREKFICADCEHKCLAFNDAHIRKHTLVRVIQKVEKSKVSTEERLEAIEEELSKMRQLISKLFEKGASG